VRRVYSGVFSDCNKGMLLGLLVCVVMLLTTCDIVRLDDHNLSGDVAPTSILCHLCHFFSHTAIRISRVCGIEAPGRVANNAGNPGGQGTPQSVLCFITDSLQLSKVSSRTLIVALVCRMCVMFLATSCVKSFQSSKVSAASSRSSRSLFVRLSVFAMSSTLIDTSGLVTEESSELSVSQEVLKLTRLSMSKSGSSETCTEPPFLISWTIFSWRLEQPPSYEHVQVAWLFGVPRPSPGCLCSLLAAVTGHGSYLELILVFQLASRACAFFYLPF